MELIAVLLCLFTAAAVILDNPEPVRRKAVPVSIDGR